jgi:hypothetical protein
MLFVFSDLWFIDGKLARFNLETKAVSSYTSTLVKSGTLAPSHHFVSGKAWEKL